MNALVFYLHAIEWNRTTRKPGSNYRQPKPGKIAVTPIKPLTNQDDFSMACSLGVNYACEEIVADPAEANTLTSRANLLIMPNLDAANISFNLLKVAAGDNLAVGPILLGAAKPVNILTPTATVRRIVNLTALTAVNGQ